MKTYISMFAVIVFAAGAMSLLAGCDREVSHTVDTKTSSNGSVKEKETTVKEAPDGTVTKEKTEKTTSPNP